MTATAKEAPRAKQEPPVLFFVELFAHIIFFSYLCSMNERISPAQVNKSAVLVLFCYPLTLLQGLIR